jgi:UDP-N-acetylglucosamine 2-epimerase (non-hydrolysing)
MKIVLVAGARPNFMKIAPLYNEIRRWNEKMRLPRLRFAQARNDKGGEKIDVVLVHTGQHYDYEMDRVFFIDLELPKPDFYLGVGSGTHAEQTAKVMLGFEKILDKEKPAVVVVVGDVNSTLGCALATAKWRCGVGGGKGRENEIATPSARNDRKGVARNDKGKRSFAMTERDRLWPLIVHVEAGLRSFDRLMPEEINRQLTDSLSDLLFTPSSDADENLRREGIPQAKIYQVGDIMVDSLLANKEKAKRSDILQKLGLKVYGEKRESVKREWEDELNTSNQSNTINLIDTRDAIDSTNSRNSITPYAVLTLHRPSNVDNRESLLRIIEALTAISTRIPILYIVHPRSRKQIEAFGLTNYFHCWNGLPLDSTGIYALEPLGYLDFLCLEMNAQFVMTDSGGIQEETTVLGVPCLTLRYNTERPITVAQGTNILVGNDTQKIIGEAVKILNGEIKQGTIYKLWDGRTAERIVEVIVRIVRSETEDVRREK